MVIPKLVAKHLNQTNMDVALAVLNLGDMAPVDAGDFG
jgi:hypothetical protein